MAMEKLDQIHPSSLQLPIILFGGIVPIIKEQYEVQGNQQAEDSQTNTIVIQNLSQIKDKLLNTERFIPKKC